MIVVVKMQMMMVMTATCLVRMRMMMVRDVRPRAWSMLCEIEGNDAQLMRIARGMGVRDDILTNHNPEFRVAQLTPG